MRFRGSMVVCFRSASGPQTLSISITSQITRSISPHVPSPQPQTLLAEQASNKHLSLFPLHRDHPGELYLTLSHAPICRKHTQPPNSSFAVVSVVLVTPGLASSLVWLRNFSRRCSVFPGGRDPSMLQVLGTPGTKVLLGASALYRSISCVP